MDPGNLPVTLMRMFPHGGRPLALKPRRMARGAGGPSDLLMSHRVAPHNGLSVFCVRDRLLVCMACYCLCNFSSQEDFPIKRRKKKKKEKSFAWAFKQTKCGTCVHTRFHTHAQFPF